MLWYHVLTIWSRVYENILSNGSTVSSKHLFTYLVLTISRHATGHRNKGALHCKPSLPNQRKRSHSQLPSYFLSLQNCVIQDVRFVWRFILELIHYGTQFGACSYLLVCSSTVACDVCVRGATDACRRDDCSMISGNELKNILGDTEY